MKRRWCALILLCFVLAGCQSTRVYKPAPSHPAGLLSLQINDVTVEVQAQEEEDQSYQWVPQRFLDQAKQWFETRFQAQGGESRGFLVVRQAVLKETALPKETGVSTWFSKQPSEQYDAVLDISFEVRDAYGFAKSMANAHVQRTTSVMEGISLEERGVAIQKLINSVLKEVDAELVRNMGTFLPHIMNTGEGV